ncbi:MAG: CRISPR-associated endonuclease Cas2 [Candidatus Bathyarchaeota archaeon]|nr:CRISPR-associated endonuclease Cas2 [Candidatus Bathyarchaeota archaeon]
MKKNMYYAVYDISDDKTRTHAIQALKDVGFIRIQKSVFCGSLASQQKKDLIEALKRITGENESVYLILTCQKCFGKVTIIGHGFDKEYVANDLESMVL